MWEVKITHSVWQDGEIDGEIIGIQRGIDDTMHIEIRDGTGLVSNFVCKDLTLALEIAKKHLRRGTVRLFVDGKWNRTIKGWKSDAKQCEVNGYESLRNASLTKIMDELRQIPGNGWREISDVEKAWREIRGKLIKTSANHTAKLEGKIVGVFGRNEEMHITVRDYSGRIFKLLADVPTGCELARHLRGGFLRLQTKGVWHRTNNGWTIDPNKCHVIGFSKLEDIDALSIFQKMRNYRLTTI